MESTHGPGTRVYVTVWIGLLAIVGVEVVLTYMGLAPGLLLAALLTLAILEAGLGLLYFMHLRYERRILFWSLVPSLVFVFLLMNHLWRDAARMVTLHP
ncbi:MAG: cytochrome C oxidase subunit IV family protein [Gemmatimonadales bacterium]